MAAYKKPSVVLSARNAAYGKKYAGTSGVKWIQEKLKKMGYYGGSIDGYYGPKMVTAVKEFQKTHLDKYGNKLVADGSCGPLTIETIERVSKLAYQIRRTTPARDNQYYKIGGKNYFQGKYNGFNSGGNCTWYAYGRFCEIQGNWSKPPIKGAAGQSSAGNWRNRITSGLAHGSVPEQGAVAVWYDPNGRRAGHVAIVEKVNSDGTLYISESGWKSYLFRTSTTHSGGSRGQIVSWMDRSPYNVYKLWGYIYNPAVHGSQAGNPDTGSGGHEDDPEDTAVKYLTWKYQNSDGSLRLNQDNIRNNGILAYLYFRNAGWKIRPICAVLGNMQWESTINPATYQGFHPTGDDTDTSLGYGLVQWTPPSKIKNWLASHGYAARDGDAQCKWIDEETTSVGQWINRGSYYETFSAFKNDVTHNTEWLTRCFERCFEGSADGANSYAMQQRIDYANAWETFIRGNNILGYYAEAPGGGSTDSDDQLPNTNFPDVSNPSGNETPKYAGPPGSYHKPDNKHILIARKPIVY